MYELVREFKPDTIINLVLFFQQGESTIPQTTWKINVDGVINTLEIARQENLQVFNTIFNMTFGGKTPLDNTPQTTIQRPSLITRVTKFLEKFFATILQEIWRRY